jgi:hypothetical protein
MKIPWLLSYLAVAAISASVLPKGNGVGGGCVVTCGERHELLDFYEMHRVPPYRTLDLGAPTLSVEQKVHLALQRLASLDPVRADRFLARANAFFSGHSTRYVPGIHFELFPDVGPVSLPSDCRLEQLALQKKSSNPSERLYAIDSDLRAETSNDDFAGLVLHEIVYTDGLALGQKDSTRVRRYVGLLASSDMNTLSGQTYSELVDAFFEKPRKLTFQSDIFEFFLIQHQFTSIDLSQLLVGSVAKPLRWTALDALPRGVKLVPNKGYVQGTLDSQIFGRQTVNIAVTDGQDGAVTRVELLLAPDNHFPPVWVARSFRLRFQGQVGEPVHATLSQMAFDDDNRGLRFQKSLGPSWLEISPEGDLSGTPPTGSEGENEWAVAVRNSSQSSVATIRMTILPSF